MAFRFRPSLLATRNVRTSFNAQQYLASTTRRIQPAFALQSLRCRSTAGNGAQSGAAETRTITIPTLPKVLIGLALACLTVGLYEYLVSDIQKYPPDIRQALRKALYYQHNGKDLNSSVKYFREALQLALESSEMERDGAPLTGIMIQLGALLESMGRLPEARQTLTLALRHLAGFENDRDSPSNKPDSAFFDLDVGQLPPATQKKLVGIAQKLGDINASMKRDEDAEKWYTWSVEHLLKISSKPVSPYGDSDQIIFDKEHMPKWLTETEMGAALEALGGFYAERNKPSYAIHLYLRALTLSGAQNCHSTVIMNNLSEAFASMGRVDEAKQWAERGLELAENPNTAKIDNDAPVCNESYGVLLYNMGILLEQTDDKNGAIAYYEKARNHGRQYKLLECIQQSNLALRRLQQQQ